MVAKKALSLKEIPREVVNYIFFTNLDRWSKEHRPTFLSSPSAVCNLVLCSMLQVAPIPLLKILPFRNFLLGHHPTH